MINYTPIKILFEIAGFKVYSWGTIFIIAFLIAFFLILREAKKKRINEKHIYNLGLIILIGAIVGARLFYVLEQYTYFISNPLEVFSIWDGGMISYGAFLSLILIWLYVRKQPDLRFTKILDLFAPYLALAIAITRIGCFLNWCCYGLSSNLPWAMKVGQDVARHPTQLYESITSFIIFILLLKFRNMRDKLNKKTGFKILLKNPGTLFFLFLLLYSFFRFFNDFLREYPYYLLGLSVSQWIFLILFIFSFIIITKSAKFIIEKIKTTKFLPSR